MCSSRERASVPSVASIKKSRSDLFKYQGFCNYTLWYLYSNLLSFKEAKRKGGLRWCRYFMSCAVQANCSFITSFPASWNEHISFPKLVLWLHEMLYIWGGWYASNDVTFKVMAWKLHLSNPIRLVGRDKDVTICLEGNVWRMALAAMFASFWWDSLL